MNTYVLTHLSDSSLRRELNSLVARDRALTSALLSHLAEFDSRRLYLAAAYPSMFAYCVGELRFSEEAAFKRIRAARMARRFPVILAMLADGRLHLTAVVMLASVLTQDNAGELLAAAVHRSKSELEKLLAERFPRPDLPEEIMVLAASPPALRLGTDSQLSPGTVELIPSGQSEPTAAVPSTKPTDRAAAAFSTAPAAPDSRQLTVPGDSSIATTTRARLTALSPRRYALQVTVAQETFDKLERARDLLRHQVPGGELEQVLDRALDALIAKLEQRKCAATDRPRAAKAKPNASSNPRHIPAAVRRAVWQRDRGQCTFVSATGHRCDARGHLEFDHELPVARGGRSTAGNLRLRCRAHNQLEAERAYGAGFMHDRREAARERAGRSHGAAIPDSARGRAPC